MNGLFSTACINASIMNISRQTKLTKISEGRVIHKGKIIGLYKPMDSLSTCHLGFWFGWKSCSFFLNICRVEYMDNETNWN